MATPLNTAPSATSQDVSSGAATLLGWKPVGPNNTPQPVQISVVDFVAGMPLPSLVPSVPLSASTTDTTQTALSGVPVLPNVVCAMRLIGHVTAFNLITGDAISWDIAALIHRAAIGAAPAIVGQPSVTLFAANDDMTGCELAIGTDQTAGILVLFTGLASTPIAVVSSILFAPRSTQ